MLVSKETPGRRAFSVAVYLRNDNRVLVIKHRRLSTWLPIGGELEEHETPLEAAVRELEEETGISGQFALLAHQLDGEPPGLIGYEEHPAGAKGMHLNFVFVADAPVGAVVRANHEYDEYRWVTAEELTAIDCPLNVRQFGYRALAAKCAAPSDEFHFGIRKAELADASAITELMAAQLAEHEIPFDVQRLRAAVAGVLELPERGAFLVADEASQLVGAAFVAFGWSLEHAGTVAWLEELYVVPLQRGGGIGGNLVQAARRFAATRGARVMELEVERGHERAANLYSREGFHKLSRTRWQASLP